MIPLKPRCPCGNTKFHAVDTVITTTRVSEFYIEDATLRYNFEDCGAEVHWDSSTPLDESWECTECGARFTDAEIKALPHGA